MTFNKPCLDCGKVTQGSRCPGCQTQWERIRSNQRPVRAHYAGDYKRRAKQIRETAVACWICGDGWREGDPWQADHVVAGDPLSVLLPAHRSCNSKRFNQRKNKK